MNPDNWLVPDVSVSWPNQPQVNGYLQGSPMIAVEIVSPGNSANEIQHKTHVYLNHGAAEVWVVYPLLGTMMVHKPDDQHKTITDTYKSDLLPVTVKLSGLFSQD